MLIRILRNIKSRGVAMVEYAVLLAFVCIVTEDAIIVTDLYRINYTKGGTIEHVEDSGVKTKVAVNKKTSYTDSGHYNVIRNADTHVKKSSIFDI